MLTWSVISDLFCSGCDCFLLLLVYFLPSCNSTSFRVFFHTDSKTTSRLSSVDFLTVFTWNPVNAFSCVFFTYLVLRMNQKVSDSHVGPDGRGDAMTSERLIHC